MMKITGLSHLFKWENLHYWWLTKYYFAPLYMIIYKGILRLLPSYLCEYIQPRAAGLYSLRSQESLLLSVPSVRTEAGKTAFQYSAPTAWNNLQKDWKLKDLIPIGHFKRLLKGLEMRSMVCNCFMNF